MALVDDILAKCEEVQAESEFLKTLAGKAGDAKWAVVDPGLAMLRAMADAQALIILAKANELQVLIP